MVPAHLKPQFDPVPNPDAVVRAPNIRITVLTSRLLRFEYSPTDTFEDRASQPFWYRNQAAPEYNFAQKGDLLELATAHLTLSYMVGAPPSPERFSIHVHETDQIWQYGDEDSDNLQGTYRTLDTIDGKVPLEKGLLSRSGWAVVDDSHTLVFDNQGWLEPRKAPQGTVDLYFFGYGLAFQECLQDYRKIAGRVPMLPRWALGNWWSRYWKYSADDIRALIKDFQNHRLPLSVFIIDMDWHVTDTGNTSSGWTGYTWNKDLFPDPKGLIKDIHREGLRTALNLHPAAGVYPHEAQYRSFAKAMGMDPKEENPIPFDLVDPKFAKAYFELLHHPLEADGVDFWWLDWQQGSFSKLPGLDPLWWLNHLHFYDLSRPRKNMPKPRKKADANPDADTAPVEASRTRSFIFSRWGGLGNHRYPIGFSGDTVVTWGSLQFQPYFTATAANVGYGWWSHDIGGHMGGIEDPELYTRWSQYGLLSPVFRFHCTNNPYHERRPFGYDEQTYNLVRHVMQLRHAFIPYLYTMSWVDYNESISPIRPLYHLSPEQEPAYHYPNVYTFGSELIAAPYVTPLNPETRLARQPIWLPEGDWYQFFTGEHVSGGHHVLHGPLSEIPLFAKAGAIVPIMPLPQWGGVEAPSHLKIHVFPGADNQFDLYEDDGNTNAYQVNQYGITPFTQKWEGDKTVLTIGPVRGDASLLPARRTYQIQFWGIEEPDQVVLRINGAKRAVSPEYLAEKNMLIVPVQAEILPADTVIVTLKRTKGNLLVRPNRTLAACKRMLQYFRMESWTKGEMLQHLPELLENPMLFARYRPSLTDTQLRALMEVITGAGAYRVQHTERDTLVLWNPAEHPDVKYQFSINQIRPASFPERFYLEHGTIPDFKVFKVAAFKGNPWQLRLNYFNVLDVPVL